MIAGYTQVDTKRNSFIREICDKLDLVWYTRQRHREWNAYVSGVEDNRFPKIAMDNKSNKIRPLGRPTNSWSGSPRIRN